MLSFIKNIFLKGNYDCDSQYIRMVVKLQHDRLQWLCALTFQISIYRFSVLCLMRGSYRKSPAFCSREILVMPMPWQWCGGKGNYRIRIKVVAQTFPNKPEFRSSTILTQEPQRQEPCDGWEQWTTVDHVFLSLGQSFTASLVVILSIQNWLKRQYWWLFNLRNPTHTNSHFVR